MFVEGQKVRVIFGVLKGQTVTLLKSGISDHLIVEGIWTHTGGSEHLCYAIHPKTGKTDFGESVCIEAIDDLRDSFFEEDSGVVELLKKVKKLYIEDKCGGGYDAILVTLRVLGYQTLDDRRRIFREFL